MSVPIAVDSAPPTMNAIIHRARASYAPPGSAIRLDDVTLGYDTKVWGRKVDFVLNVNNVLDSVYIEGQRVFGAPREFFLSARMAF